MNQGTDYTNDDINGAATQALQLASQGQTTGNLLPPVLPPAPYAPSLTNHSTPPPQAATDTRTHTTTTSTSPSRTPPPVPGIPHLPKRESL